MIEGRYRSDHPHGLDNRKCSTLGARRRQPHGDFLPRHGTQLIGRIAHAVDGTVGFDKRIGQRFATLACNLSAEMLALRLHQVRELAQDRDFW